MASPKQTLHPIFLKKWMGKIEDPRKLNFFTPPTSFSEDLSPYHAELAVASGKPTSGLPVIRSELSSLTFRERRFTGSTSV